MRASKKTKKRKTKRSASADSSPASTRSTRVVSPAPLVRVPGVGRGKGASGAFPEFNRTELARKLGVHKSTISNLLAGRRDLSDANARVCAEAMGIELGKFQEEVARQRSENGIAPQRKKRGLTLIEPPLHVTSSTEVEVSNSNNQ